MYLSQKRIVGDTNKFRKPVVNAGKNREHSTHGKNVVEVSDDVISIMESYIEAGIGKNNTSYATDGEKENETNGEQHCRSHSDGSTPHSSNSAEDFNSCWYSNNHGGCCEIRASIDVKSDHEHMVCPN